MFVLFHWTMCLILCQCLHYFYNVLKLDIVLPSDLLCCSRWLWNLGLSDLKWSLVFFFYFLVLWRSGFLFEKIYLFERQSDKESKRVKEIFHLLVHFHKGNNGWCWARTNLESGTPSPSPTLVAKTQVLESSCPAFSITLTESWIKSRADST